MSIVANVTKYGQTGGMIGSAGEAAGGLLRTIDASDGNLSKGGSIASSALSWAGKGASLGAFGGPVGMAIGAAAGGILGAVMGNSQHKAAEKQAAVDRFQSNMSSRPIPPGTIDATESQYGGGSMTHLGQKFGIDESENVQSGILQALTA